jgi:hypothetical protein
MSWSPEYERWLEAGKPPAPRTVEEMLALARMASVPQLDARAPELTEMYRAIDKLVLHPDADSPASLATPYLAARLNQAFRPAFGLTDIDITVMSYRGTTDIEQVPPGDLRLAEFWAKFYEQAEKYGLCDVADNIVTRLGGPRRKGVWVPIEWRPKPGSDKALDTSAASARQKK